MKKQIPIAESVLAFLHFKGWKLEEKTSGFYIVTPPEDVQPKIQLKIPHLKKELAYPIMIVELVNEIANFYDINKFVLRALLSKKTKQIEKMLYQVISKELKVITV